MKKVIYLILFVFVVGGIYYAFLTNVVPSRNKTVSIQNLVPSDAIICFEKSVLSNLLKRDSLQNFEWISNSAPIEKIVIFAQKIDSLFPENEIYISSHFTGKETVRSVFYIKNKNENYVEKIFSIKEKGYTKIYKDVEFQVFQDSICQLVVGDFVILTNNQFIMENCIRTIEDGKGSVIQANSFVISPSKFYKLLTDNIELKEVFSLLGQSNISINFETDNIQIQGLGTGISDTNSSIELGKYKTFFPMNTALATNGSIDYLKQKNILQEPIYNLVKDDLVVLFLENKDKLEKVFITNKINMLTNNFSKVEKSSFKDIELTNLSYLENSDTQLVTIAKVEDYYLISESQNAVFDIIQAMQDDNVWGKSLKHYDFLSELGLNASTSILINAKLLTATSSKFDLIAFQQMASEQGVLLNGIITQNSNFISSAPTNNQPKIIQNSNISTSSEVIATMNSTIISKPYITKNHTNGAREFLFQTEDNALHLLTFEGKNLWNKQLDAPINSTIEQIDVYKNRKLQYVFTTKNQIYIVDRNGKNVEGFPKKMKYEIGQFSVIDYENDKNYRFAVSDIKGNIYLYDLNGKTLGDWKPKSIDAGLVAPLQHFRIKDKDCLLAVSKAGKIHLFKRNGSYYEGFPLELFEQINTNYSLTKSNDFSKTNVQILTELGTFYTLTMKGNKTKNSEINVNSNAYNVISSDFKYSVLAQLENNLLSIFNNSGTSLFQTEQKMDTIIQSQLYHFNSQNDLIAFVTNNSIFIYDIVGLKKIEVSANPQHISLLNFEAKNQNIIYYSEGKQLKKAVL